jgi:hypothetical protein
VTIEAWNETHNLVRRVRGIVAEYRSRLEIEVERFAGRTGRLTLADLAHPVNRDAGRRGARLKYRERFRRSLLRQFPDWRLAELSTEADVHHSLSPSYPRAFLRKGSVALAAIGAAEDALDPDGALTFGLIWLDYLRRREPRTGIQGLVVFVPVGRGNYLPSSPLPRSHDCPVRSVGPPCGRLGRSRRASRPYQLQHISTQKSSRVGSPLAGSRTELLEWVGRLAAGDAVERRDQPDGSVSLAVRGLEFARASGENLLFGLEQRRSADEAQLAEIEALAEGLAAMRHAAANTGNPLYSRHPEAWLESQVRADIEKIDAQLLSRPVYGQVPQFTGGERGAMDLLACRSLRPPRSD